MEYFIIDNSGQQAGPFSLDQLAQKGITPETLVWKQGMADWTPAWKVEELRNTLEAAEAVRDHQAQNVPPGSLRQGQQTSQQGYGQTTQQDFQQAQQDAYQRGFQQGAAMYQGSGRPDPPRKKPGKMLWKIILGLIAVIILALAVTNPGEEAHKEKVRAEASKAIEKATASTDNNFFSQALRSVAKMMAEGVMGEAMDQLFVYHNYIVCSKGGVEFNGKEHTVSFGILGRVYTMNADDMVKALQSNGVPTVTDDSQTTASPDTNDNSGEATGSEPSADTDDQDAQQGDEEAQGDIQQRLEDKANQALDRAADKMGKKVKEKIKQKIDEATDSSTIDKIIDKIASIIE